MFQLVQFDFKFIPDSVTSVVGDPKAFEGRVRDYTTLTKLNIHTDTQRLFCWPFLYAN